MGRGSTKEYKNAYQQAREHLGLSREEAAERVGMSTSRLTRLEYETTQINPWDVDAMAKAYQEPRLRNYHCANECPIGKCRILESEPKTLAQTTLEMLACFQLLQNKQSRLIEITADGQIKDDEVEDFIHIQRELEQISVAVESLKLWTEERVVKGKINVAKYKEALNRERVKK